MKKVKELKENECILCTTMEEDDAIRDLMHEAWLKWCNNYSYKNYHPTKELPNQCYRPFIWTYCHKEFAEREWYTIYPASDFIFAPKRGDLVEVSDDEKVWHKRIYLTTIEGSRYPFLCVDEAQENYYKNKRKFTHVSRKYMKSQLASLVL